MASISRPATSFTPHEYTLNGEKLLGISTVSHVGGAEDDFGVGSAWGFRIGHQGVFSLLDECTLLPFDVTYVDDKDHTQSIHVDSSESLREALKKRKLTPWDTRDEAAGRGTWVHDVLEELAQNGTVPDLERYVDPIRGHVLSILRWYVRYQPVFVATEVQVTSEQHLFAGRYDIRCKFKAAQLLSLFKGYECPQADRIRALALLNAPALSLVDLKTSKRVIPTKHYVQLMGYDGASVEMGFDPTDAQFILLSHEDGSPATLSPSWAQYGDFLAYLEALRAIRRVKEADPENRLKQMHEDALLTVLKENPDGVRSRDLVTRPEFEGMSSAEIGKMFGKLAVRKFAEKGRQGLWLPGRRLLA